MTSFYNWIGLNETSNVELDVPDGIIIGCIHVFQGQKESKPLPHGRYRVINPVSGKAARAINNQVVLVPASQQEDDAQDGSYFYISKLDLQKLMA